MKCADKRHYLTKAAAETAATRTHRAQERGTWLYPYQCDLCGLWHLTSWTPSQQAIRMVGRQMAFDRKQQPGITTIEPPSLKALRTHLVQVTAAIRLDERRQDAARLKRAEAIGKLVAADEAMRKAEDDYRAAQDEALRILGMLQD